MICKRWVALAAVLSMFVTPTFGTEAEGRTKAYQRHSVTRPQMTCACVSASWEIGPISPFTSRRLSSSGLSCEVWDCRRR